MKIKLMELKRLKQPNANNGFYFILFFSASVFGTAEVTKQFCYTVEVAEPSILSNILHNYFLCTNS